ncbi:MAG: PEP-CTERM sorting domain-containing protein [Blastocatellia bacterium]
MNKLSPFTNNRQSLRYSIVIFSFAALLWCSAAPLEAQERQAATARKTAPSVLFIGNSFTFGSGTPVQIWRPETVTDLNGTGIGGVPAIFKALVTQAGRDFNVSLETSPGKNLEFHFREKAEVIGQSWDYVLLQGHSLLDKDKPGNAATHARAAKALAELLRGKNPRADIRLVATWSRADQTYPETGHWHGQPIEKMALDVRRGYDMALRESAPLIRQVIPVGEAWNRAIKTGLADPNPYDGITPGQLDLWGRDHYHASVAGYYLEALMIFGALTELDPRSLGRGERAASELGLSPEQAVALQKVAAAELKALKKQRRLPAEKREGSR